MIDGIEFALKYYDLFDFPLTKEEVFRWSWGHEITKSENHKTTLTKTLGELIEGGEVEQLDGFYFLKGRGKIVQTRKQREVISKNKIEKAKRIVKLMKLIPGVKMIALASNVAYLNAEKQADIDFFIVTKKNKIWTARFWSVILMKFLHKRPSKKNMEDKICLSYFVDEENMNLEITKMNEPDVHLIYLISQYRPLYDAGGVWNKFAQENEWIKKYLVNFEFSQGSQGESKVINSKQGFDDKFYKKIQLKVLAKHLREARDRNDNSVIINDGMLKMHSNDKRREINNRILHD